MTTSRPAGSRSFSLTDIIGVGFVAGGLATLFTTLLASTVLRPIVVVSDAPAPPGSAPAGSAPPAFVITAPSPTVNPDGSWPAVRREREVAVTRADKLEVVRVERIASEDPFWAAWTQAPFVVVPLMPQQMAMPRAEAASIQELRVQGLTDGRSIAWRIGWDDATPDGNVDTGRFSDAVAIGFPLDPGAPPMMGARGLRVQILYWKALWQKDADAGFQDVQSLHPNYWSDLYWFAEGQFPYPVPSAFQLPASRQWFIAHQAGNPMAAFSRTQPIEELVAEGWSATKGKMHACGHDGHVASLLGVAERLVARPDFAGRVRLCFQPAEEGAGGAARMLAEGILDGVDAAFGVHVWNDLAVGKVALATGPVMAAVDKLDIELEGVGGHGAMPQQTRDPVVAAAHLVVALQTIVSRETSPLDSAVVTIGSLQAGTNWNVIPRTARLAGTARTYARPTYEAIQGRIERVTRGVADALCCKATIGYERICPPLVNHPQATALARQVAAELLGADAVVTEGTGTRTMGGEDFAFFLERVPGCFVFVGSRNEARGLMHPHHSPRFDFDEGALGHSVRVLEGIARRYMASGLPTT